MKHWKCFATAITFSLLVGHHAEILVAAAEDMCVLTDVELAQRTDAELHLADQLHHEGRLISGEFRTTEYEQCLTEIIRRGGEKWVPFLRSRLAELDSTKIKRGEQDQMSTPGQHYNQELLTALRRVQKRPDPLRIIIDADVPVVATLPNLPMLKVAIQNVDQRKHDVGFTFGGNYRSGCQARWRVVLTKVGGGGLPSKQTLGLFSGGGQYTTGVLGHGESWTTTLDIRRFVQTPAPGSYNLQVLYHNTKTIAHKDSIDGMIVSSSRPVRLVIKPLSLRPLTDAERVCVEELIADLDGKRPVRILAGTYGKWAHAFIAPDTPEGNLLSKGPIIIPHLLDVLRTDQLTPKQRARVFAILFSLTGDHDPRWRIGLMGPYKCRVAVGRSGAKEMTASHPAGLA